MVAGKKISLAYTQSMYRTFLSTDALGRRLKCDLQHVCRRPLFLEKLQMNGLKKEKNNVFSSQFFNFHPKKKRHAL